MRVLVVNAGSTSLKLHLVESGSAEPLSDFVDADAVGHRVVAGGTAHHVIDDATLAAIRTGVEIAPLHNVPALRGIEEARTALPDVPHVAVYDSAFHATIPDVAATYAVPSDWGIRRVGFHGLSVAWVASQVRVPRLVVCHLGGGCSVTAVRDGRSVDTTMGFTPLEGVPMATRSGSIDPGAMLWRLRTHPLDEVADDLEHRSGLLALGGNADVRETSPFALEVFTYRVAGAVAAMAAALGGLDALAFTAGIGENAAGVREAICDRLAFLGDFELAVVPAREELVIAREVEALLLSAGSPACRGRPRGTA